MKRLDVRHEKGNYALSIAPGLLTQSKSFAAVLDRPLLIVTDENVAAHWLTPVENALPGVPSLVLPAGESSKTLDTASRIWNELARLGLGRDCVLVALGGGVIGDVTGFAASCWMRGVDFIQVPTTLLAQVDSSIGGKTAVDLPAGKNLVGAFHQPLAVIADTDTLQTLPRREYAAGFAEVVKAALLADAHFFSWLEAHSESLTEHDSDALLHAIETSCRIKADIVVEDEREQGRRALLNLGHTFAHALELVSGFELLHGEAVAIGMVQALHLSERLLGLDPALRERLVDLLMALGLPVSPPPSLDYDALLDAMRLDKKHKQDAWRLILLHGIGKAEIVTLDDPAAVRAVLAGP